MSVRGSVGSRGEGCWNGLTERREDEPVEVVESTDFVPGEGRLARLRPLAGGAFKGPEKVSGVP